MDLTAIQDCAGGCRGAAATVECLLLRNFNEQFSNTGLRRRHWRMSVALTLHQFGVPGIVFESVPEIKPLGVGINLQPNAVRELYELGFGPEALDTMGLQTKEFVLVGLNGNEGYSEWRGLKAGYKWPQYSVHRSGLQMLLYRAAL